MPVPHISENFGDLLDIRFQKIFYDEYDELPDMLPNLFSFPPTNGRNDMRWSSVGQLPNFSEFAGQVKYNSQSQGYDVVSTPKEFTNGIMIERKLYDDSEYNIMDLSPQALANSAFRSRQEDGARVFDNAFSVDNYFYVNSEGVALCSNSHTTTSGASTATGFDNLSTSSLTATAIAASRIQMVKFRGDQAERISVIPDEILGPPDLYERAFEIISANGKLDVATNNPNVHKGKYTFYEWNYLNDSNNFFVMASSMRRSMLHWVERIPVEFAMVEDFDTLLAKWRAYMRHANAVTNWRWINGHQVT